MMDAMDTTDLHPYDIRPFTTFEEAVQSVLQFLHGYIGFQLWMFTRVDGEDWIILSAHDHGYNVKSGDVLNWSDSFCSRMIEGLGPRIASSTEDIPVYAEAPINQQVPISAYVGIPIYRRNGSLFGTLCAIDPTPQLEGLQQYLPLLELQSRLLTTILQAELDAQDRQRKLERVEAEAQLDPLTGLYNRRAWDGFLVKEEERCKRYGSTASIVVVDLDDLKLMNDSQGHLAGDCLLKMAAEVLQRSVRASDTVARLGGDEFSVLMVDATADSTEQVVDRIRANLEASGIRASVGWAIRLHQSDLWNAFDAADRAMYQEKLIRKTLLNCLTTDDVTESNS